MLHVKEPGSGAEERVVDLARAHEALGKITVSSSDPSVLGRVRSLEPGIRTSLIGYFWDWRFFLGRAFKRLQDAGAARIVPKGSTITDDMIGFFHERGVTVRAWGVGRNELLAARLIRLGVDGMTFDHPALLWRILDAETETRDAS